MNKNNLIHYTFIVPPWIMKINLEYNIHKVIRKNIYAYENSDKISEQESGRKGQ